MKLFEPVAVVGLLAPSVLLFLQIKDEEIRAHVLWAAIASVACYATTVLVIPTAASYLLKRGLAGKDRGKMGTAAGSKDIPSALGLICGVVYMVFIIVTQLVYAKKQGEGSMLADYSAALLSICFMVLLGFADDALDLPWRYKLLLPSVASLPLLASYRGVTTVLLPKFARSWIWNAVSSSNTWFGDWLESAFFLRVEPSCRGAILDLGPLFYLFMGLLAVFCTNAINIYAGINGLEAGQSFIIGCAVLFANAFELSSGVSASSPHLFSALLAMPFLAVTLGLLKHNSYPASVFVGDTFCYFAGMSFAVMGILGHFSKTLLLFFIPQCLNFLLSLPQLFKLYPCPRHRMPDYDPKTDKLLPSFFVPKEWVSTPAASSASTTDLKIRSPQSGKKSGRASSPAGSALRQRRGKSPAAASSRSNGDSNGNGGFHFHSAARGPQESPMAPLRPTEPSPQELEAQQQAQQQAQQPPQPPQPPPTYPPYRPPYARDNLTLINLVLRVLGPMHERTAVNVLLGLQVLCCVAGLLIRYNLSSVLWFDAHEGLPANNGHQQQQHAGMEASASAAGGAR